MVLFLQMNGSTPTSNDEVLLDFIKISYNVAGGYTGIPITGNMMLSGLTLTLFLPSV